MFSEPFRAQVDPEAFQGRSEAKNLEKSCRPESGRFLDQTYAFGTFSGPDRPDGLPGGVPGSAEEVPSRGQAQAKCTETLFLNGNKCSQSRVPL